MLSYHLPSAYGHDLNFLFAGAFVAVGFGLAKILSLKAASAAVKAKP